MDEARHAWRLRVFRALVSLVFFLSGFCSLVLQVIWQRVLSLYYGVGPIAIGAVVALFMLGLGAGAAVGGRLADRSRRPVVLYLAIEFLLCLFSAVSLAVIQAVGELTATRDAGLTVFASMLMLSIPTMLMGMGLPVVSTIFRQHDRSLLSSLSQLYFLNTIGAATGVLIGSFALITQLGLDRSLQVVVGIEAGLVGLICIAQRMTTPPVESRASTRASGRHARPVSCPPRLALAASVFTGFVAIGYEVIWFRMTGVLVKSSPYAFASTLAVYLLGVALGSLALHRFIERHPGFEPRAMLCKLQVAIAVAASLPVLLVKHGMFATFAAQSFAIELHPPPTVFSAGCSSLRECLLTFDFLVWPLVFVFLPAVGIGASFPLLTALVGDPTRGTGKTVGQVYLATVIGNVGGSLVTTFFLLPWLGTEHTLSVFVGAGFGFLPAFHGCISKRKLSVVLLTAAAVIMIAMLPGKHRFYELIHRSASKEGDEAYLEEGVDGVVVTFVNQNRVTNWINGQSHGGRPVYGFYQQALAALACIAHPRKALVIGYGTGSFVETLLQTPEIEAVVLVEISETLLINLRKIPFFATMLADKKLTVIVDDGRRFLLRNSTKFDLIMMDPLRSTSAYSGNLNSVEFFALAKASLRQGGIFHTWTDHLPVVGRTLAAVFPHSLTYSGFVLSSTAEIVHDHQRYEALMQMTLDKEERERMQGSRLYAPMRRLPADGSDAVNRDLWMVSEYYLGRPRRRL